MRSLRTRLFITVGIVLAAAIAASSLMSRRATLVEVRTVVGHPAVENRAVLQRIGTQVESQLRSAGATRPTGLDALLRASTAETGHPFVLVDGQRRVLAGSSPRLAAAHVRDATPGGTLSLDLSSGSGDGAFELRGAPAYAVRDAAGKTVAHLFQLPEPLERPASLQSRVLPPWIVATAGIAAIALVLTFALSRRILGPVDALTKAAERMRRGDLEARVPVSGGDEISELSRSFNGMAERIAETERLRRQLVSDVAHELRSPVTNLRCTLEGIQDGLIESDRRSIDALHDETLLLQRLIGDLQDLALADAGQLTLRRSKVDVEAVVRRAATPAPGGTPVAVIAEPGLPPISADPDRVEQVVRNLVTNARTHTPADGTITVNVRRDGDGVRIEVRDSGRGIEAEHLPHVFDRFYRADGSRTRATGGAGLGLAIVRQLVSAHGGTVTASSDGPGAGAVFVVTLPAA